MKVFAFDTALGACSVACRVDDELRGFHFENMTRGHAEVLLDRLAQVEREAGLSVKEADRLAVTVGPGTFTGVRVGLAAARALSVASGVPLMGVTTLHALAAHANRPVDTLTTVAVAIDARRGQLYFQTFDAALTARSTAAAVTPADVVSSLEALAMEGQKVLVVGSGGPVIRAAWETMAERARGRVQIQETDVQPSAADVAAIAAAAPREAPVPPATPLYLRPPDAKPQKQSHFARKRGLDDG